MKIENGGNFNLPTINVNCSTEKALFNFYKKSEYNAPSQNEIGKYNLPQKQLKNVKT